MRSTDHATLTHRAKEGTAGSLPGTYLDITVLFLPGQIEQLDNLAIDIRAASGRWITRSGIVTAIIEAAIRGGDDV